MAFVTKTWKDRLVEYAGRRKLKNVSTGEEVLMDVSRSEGTVSQAGDAFNATNMNDLEQRIKTEFDNVNSSLGGLKFGIDSDGNYGYIKDGADTVIPFKSGIYIEKLSNEGSYYNSNIIFTFVNQYKTLSMDRIEIYRHDTTYLGQSALVVMDENDNNIYDKIFYGSAQAQPAVTENLSIDLTPYIGKTIKIKFYLSQYGTIVRGIRLS